MYTEKDLKEELDRHNMYVEAIYFRLSKLFHFKHSNYTEDYLKLDDNSYIIKGRFFVLNLENIRSEYGSDKHDFAIKLADVTIENTISYCKTKDKLIQSQKLIIDKINRHLNNKMK